MFPRRHAPRAVLFATLLAIAQPCSAEFVVESVTPLDAVPVAAGAPRWSPDGKWIAFSLPKAAGIGLVRPDGSGFRTLLTDPGSGYRFAWSPDGSRIVFRAARREAGPRRYVIRVVDVEKDAIESTSDVIADAQPPTWQRGPDGMRWRTHAPTGAADGAWIGAARSATLGPPQLVQRSGGLWLREAGAATERKLSADGGLHPAWSPDGGRLVFGTKDQIAVADPAQPGAPRILCPGQHPAWSPDGRWLAFQITRDHSHAPGDGREHTADTLPHLHNDKTNHRIVESDIWIIGADGTGRHQLTATPDVLEVDPDWAPDGRAIVCRTEDTGRLLILRLTER